jgi:hypothetical protein
MAATQQFVRSLYLDLTRTAEISFNQLTTAPIPPITSEMIQDLSIVNADISANADISGSKIADASIPLGKIEDVSGQTFENYLLNIATPGPNTITSEMIVNGTITNADISDNADISGSKIQVASSSNSGVVSTVDQEFSGVKRFADGIETSRLDALGIATGGLFSRDSGNILNDPIPIIYRSVNTDTNPNNAFGFIELCLQNTNVVDPTNFIVIQIPIDVSGSSEVSSYYEVTLIGRQPITSINDLGTTINANTVETSTARCLITITGVSVTTTFLGQIPPGTGPRVTSRLLQSSAANTTNLLVGIGFRQFTAYHVKGVRTGIEPKIYFQVSSTALPDQSDVDTFFTNNITFI